ncbi:protein phosphatase 2C domain-containing protein [Chondromyces apiculatus]|uniref:Protein serine/threonine phosphatase PrpC, regulation of stationary phase n=1 Tax=Chondromyces apiculatus DSM 436 TaxID=1192034 RepID=A0A017T8M1_9BACT|nr:PP2C family serine/threonine-protein phosphatase [Chondromyces apiculatus]EYF05327.1 Protein serine/threonine phosphatase PrpC, regulation of stationary phase [Chondromyces apiculatus DSM 436]
MRAIAAGLSDVGRARLHNEDRFLLLPEYNVFLVADGMGGHKSGEVASRMAASAVARYFRGDPARPGDSGSVSGSNGASGANGADGATGDRLAAAILEANARIFARAGDSRAHRGMGTTVVAAAFSPDEQRLHVVHAGDSRCYLLREGALRQITRDHSLLEDALRERPDLTAQDLAYLPRNVITRALGISATLAPDACAESTRPGDVFILCSDGLHGLLDDTDVTRIVLEQPVLTEACALLVALANERGGRDNITVVLIRIEDDSPWPPSASPPGSTRSER